MKKIFLFIVALAAFQMSENKAFSTTITAIASGNWETGASWKGGKVPQCGDSVVIGTGMTIKVTSLVDFSSCGNPMHFEIMGTLGFQAGKKLKLPCGSKVGVAKNGLLSGESGGGNFSFIEICSSTDWASDKGNMSGPVTLQPEQKPVELVHFSAKPGTEGIILSWLTSSELNNASFAVERSKDGITFMELGKVKGTGTSQQITTYKFIDKNPVSGIQYYRLSQKDVNGTTKIMNPITIRWNHNPDFSIYPNPSRGDLYANVTSKFKKQIGLLMITNKDGNVVVSKDISFVEKTKALSLLKPSERLKPGNYVVNIICIGQLYADDVVVQ